MTKRPGQYYSADLVHKRTVSVSLLAWIRFGFPSPALSFGIAAERGGQGALLPRASTRYASFGSQIYIIDIVAL